MSKVDPLNIANTFRKNGWEWTFKDGKRTPTVAEIEDQLDKMREHLSGFQSEEDFHPQIEVGRLLMYRDGDDYVLYLYEGNLGTPSS